MNHFEYKSLEMLFDAGEKWNSLTIFSPFNVDSNSLSHIDGLFGFDFEDNSFSLHTFGYLKYRSNYYCYFSPTLINKNSGFNTFDIRQSGLGFENSWVKIQIRKGNESWGAGNNIQLALSRSSKVYDYFLLASDYGKIRVSFINGFLENIKPNTNRYITARGLEYTNKKSLIIGLSEIVVYSGENRSFDLAYLNPISSHLEIELNNRLNVLGSENSNAVWQFHIDYLFKEKVRISFNYLIDEFILDPKIEIGKENGKAYSCRIAYTPNIIKNKYFTIYSSFVLVGTPTFRHGGTGSNNFVQHGKPLGWKEGSDGQEFRIGINYFNTKNLIVNVVTGFLKYGEENISKRSYEPYKDYLKGNFPSGLIERSNYRKIEFTYLHRENYSISSSFYLSSKLNKIILKLNFPFFNLSRT